MNDSIPTVLQLRPQDNIGVATQNLKEGQAIQLGSFRFSMQESVPFGHKLALQTIEKDEPIHKYGQVIGFATEKIPAGQWVHSHNLSAGDFSRDYAFCSEIPAPPTPLENITFDAFRRANGQIGTRNYVAILSSVNCSATVSKAIARRASERLLANYPHVDGVIALTHKAGCAMQFDGEDHRQLSRVLAGFAKHPNISQFLIFGLGCETGSIPYLINQHQLVQITHPRQKQTSVRALTIQEAGGTVAAIEAGLEQIAEILPLANEAKREPVSASHLKVGLECGGSDGNSGITANPALGAAADLIVAAGGTAILGETTEIYGAEHLLTRRAKTPEVAQKLVDRIHWWEEHTRKFGVIIDNNPSPGNKAGGLTTIYEKSLGAVAKAGSTAMTAVYQYAEPITEPGMVVMDTPGFDPSSVTGMVAGGANVVCFTTGRGSCFGCKPTPSIKIATNTPMYERLSDDMDVNAGEILTGQPIEEVGQAIFQTILDVASGKKTRSEVHGIGDEEFIPWSIGPVL
ncbi:D-galactarate dehydratase [Planctomycetales bacterium 10988]|nr:D-galactarate dehydratase [Planctomycetales bacterium 10988]